MRAFELVIFDCDGVLVDSEGITNKVFAQMLNELGIPVTLELPSLVNSGPQHPSA